MAAITSSADDLALAVGEHEPAVAGVATARVWKPADERDRAVVDQAADRRAERAAGGQLVVAAAAVLAAGRAAADRPDDLRRAARSRAARRGRGSR